jgi:hypothetical protein
VKSANRRAELKKLVKAARLGDTVDVVKVDRFARSSRDLFNAPRSQRAWRQFRLAQQRLVQHHDVHGRRGLSLMRRSVSRGSVLRPLDYLREPQVGLAMA